MKKNYNIYWYIALVLFVGVILLFLFLPKSVVKEEYNLSDLMLIEENSLMAVSPIFYPGTRVYGILMNEIIECESGWEHEGIWGKAGEYGIAQFKERTFYWMAELANFQNANWFNKEHQLYLLEWALENNLGKHWTCYKK